MEMINMCAKIDNDKRVIGWKKKVQVIYSLNTSLNL